MTQRHRILSRLSTANKHVRPVGKLKLRMLADQKIRDVGEVRRYDD